MDFEKQKPVNDVYRENWERIYGICCEDNCEECPTCGELNCICETYDNGCPMLNESEHA